jgi:hypothetical protein
MRPGGTRLSCPLRPRPRTSPLPLPTKTPWRDDLRVVRPAPAPHHPPSTQKPRGHGRPARVGTDFPLEWDPLSPIVSPKPRPFKNSTGLRPHFFQLSPRGPRVPTGGLVCGADCPHGSGVPWLKPRGEPDPLGATAPPPLTTPPPHQNPLEGRPPCRPPRPRTTPAPSHKSQGGMGVPPVWTPTFISNRTPFPPPTPPPPIKT